MSLHNFFRWLFDNEEYNSVNAWYSNVSCSNALVWREFIHRVKPISEPDSFDYRDELYNKRIIYQQLISTFKKSETLISEYAEAVNIWKRSNFINNINNQFNFREKLVSDSRLILQVNHFLQLKEEYPLEVKLFIGNNKDISSINEICSVESALSLSEIKRIRKIYDKSEFLYSNYSEESIFLKTLLDIATLDRSLSSRQYIVANEKSLRRIQHYFQLRKNRLLGLTAFMQYDKLANSSSIAGIEYILKKENEIRELDKRYKRIQKQYRINDGNISTSGINEIEVLSIYDKSDQLLNNNGQEVNLWKSLMNIQSNNLSYSERKKLLHDQPIIHHVIRLKSKYLIGYNNFLKENQSIREDSFEGIQEILANESDIIERDKNFKKLDSYQELTDAIAIYLDSNDHLSVTYTKVKYVIDNIDSIKAEYEAINKWVRYYLKRSPKIVLSEFLASVGGDLTKELSYSLAYQLYYKKGLLEELKAKYRQFLDLREKYSLDANIMEFLNIQEGNWKDIERLIEKENDLSKTVSIFSAYKVLRDCHKRGLNSFLSDNPNINISNYEGLQAVLDKKEEIANRDVLIHRCDFLYGQKYKNAIRYVLKLETNFTKIPYDILVLLYEKKEEILKLGNAFETLQGIYEKYTHFFLLYLPTLQDPKLVELFPNEPLLQIQKEILEDIHRVDTIAEAIQIASDYKDITTKEKVSDFLVQVICGSQSIFTDEDFSTSTLTQKKYFIDYFKKGSLLHTREPLKLNCDLNERDTKIKIILNSRYYLSDYVFDENVPITLIYYLADYFTKYSTSFDEVLVFRSEHLDEILSFQEMKYQNTDTFEIREFELIARKDPELLDYIEKINNKKQEQEKLQNEVSRIKKLYPHGYSEAVRQRIFCDAILDVFQFHKIIENENVISAYEQVYNATIVYNANVDGVKQVIVPFPTLPLTNSEAADILKYKSLIIYKQGEIERQKKEQQDRERRERERLEQIEREKRERELARQNEYRNLCSCVSDWYCLLGGLHYNYLLKYFPTTCDFDATKDEWDDRYTVWNFKNTPGKTTAYRHNETLDIVIPKIKNVFTQAFGSYNLHKLTLVCIPASNQENTTARYQEFSERLCKETGMENSFSRIRVIHDKMERRSGGTSIQTDYLSFDSNFFRDKYVILFDDVITRGDSMRTFKSKMESLGAYVVAGFSIGKTKHER